MTHLVQKIRHVLYRFSLPVIFDREPIDSSEFVQLKAEVAASG